MPYIQPTGVIDGVNTVFTVPTTIVEVRSLLIDGLEYPDPTNYMIDVNQITLVYAPTFSFWMEYIDTPLPPPTPPISGVYFNANMNLDNLTNLVLRELKEPEVTGSEAVSVALVQDTLNMVYSEAFNDQRMKQSAREVNKSFLVANDTTLKVDMPAGASELFIDDASSFRPTGRVLALSEIIDYSANDGVDRLSGLTNVDIPQLSGTVIRQMYRLSDIAPDIQRESIQYVDINGITQYFMEYPTNTSATQYFPNSYSIFKEHLIFSRQSTIGGNNQQQSALLIYTQKVTPMVYGNDLPTLIDNSWRIPILVYGACMKIAAADNFRTSWDYWKVEYEKALSQYIAFRNTRVKDINNRRRPTLYNNSSSFPGY